MEHGNNQATLLCPWSKVSKQRKKPLPNHCHCGADEAKMKVPSTATETKKNM